MEFYKYLFLFADTFRNFESRLDIVFQIANLKKKNMCMWLWKLASVV